MHPFLDNIRPDYSALSAQAIGLPYERGVTDVHSITRGTRHFLAHND